MERYEVIKKHMDILRGIDELRWENTNNPKRYDAPSASGLYLISNTLFNPQTEEKIYIVKVGVSQNLEKRMKQYKSSNPLMYHIDFMEMKKEEMWHSELIFHWILMGLGAQPLEGCDEWFKVSEEEYNRLCEDSFAYLMKAALMLDDEFFEELEADIMN